MRIDIKGTANFNQVRGEYDKLLGRVEAVNTAMAKTAMIPQGGNVEGFAAQSRALRTANTAYAQALASSGAYTVQQFKLNDAIDQQVQLLQKQKLGFRDVFGRGAADRMRQVYRQQLAMQKGAQTLVTSGNVTDGRQIANLAIPNQIPESWDTLGKRIGFVGHKLSSASNELQNWGKNTQWAGRQMMIGIGVPLAALGASAGVMAYQVDKELTRIQKVYDTTTDANSQSLRDQMAVEKELGELRKDAMETAINSARQYGSEITKTLQTQAELAATGLTGGRLQAGTDQVMKIAALGEIEPEVATKSLIAMQQVLRASTKETADMFNYLNAVENATSLSTADFAAAIPRALGPMKQMSAEGASASDVMKNLSVLMVAMRERGVEAGEGANAIKAMMQRLYRPSQKIREEWQAIVGMDPADLVQRTGGDIMKILPMIAAAVDDLSKPDRVKALAGLFGTYQVQRMSAMLEGIENINDASSQTNAVLELNKQSVRDYASTAEREMERYRKSVAGQFDIALQTLKGEMAELGEPFVWFATYALKALGGVAAAFNDMPSWAKKATIIGTVLLAAGTAGVMLLGVFANLIGTGGKFIGTVLKGAGSFQLMTKSQLNAAIAANMAEKEFEQEANSVAILNTQIQALNRGLYQYSAAMSQARAANEAQLGVVNPGAASRPTSAAGATPPPLPIATYTNSPMAGSPIIGAGGKVNQERLNELLEEEETKRKGINKYAVGAAASTAAMAASMALMAGTSNSTLNNIGQWLMIASIAAPAASMLAGAAKQVPWKDIATKTTTWAKNTKDVAVAAASNAYNTRLAAAATGAHAAGAARSTKALAAGSAAAAGTAKGMRAAGVAVAGMMGPVGWITAAIAAIGLGAYKLWQWNKKVTAEQVAQAKAIGDQKNLLSDILDIQPRRLKTLQQMLPTSDWLGISAKDQSALDENMQKKNGDLVKAYKNGTAEDKDYIVATKYAQVLNSVGGNAQKARAYIESLFKAAGDGAVDARAKSIQYYNQLGQTIDSTDFQRTLSSGLIGAMNADEDQIKSRGTTLGKQMADAIATGGSEGAKGVGASFVTAMDSSWGAMLGQMDAMTRNTLDKLGVTTGSKLSDMAAVYQREGSDFAEYAMKNYNISAEEALALSQTLGDVFSSNNDRIQNLRNSEAAVVTELATQLGITKDIYTWSELRAQPEFKILSATKETADSLYDQLTAQKGYSREKKLAIAQQLAQTAGLRVTGDLESQLIILAQAHGNKWERNNAIMETTATKAEKIGNKLKGLPKNLNIALEFDGAQMRQMQKAGMEGLTNDLASAASNAFDSRMNAAIDANSRYWDSRIEAAQNAGEQASQNLDDRWERLNTAFENRYERRRNALERYYNRRIGLIEKSIKAEQKAEETRQKIFDAEERRMSRSSDMQNRTIDFNLAVKTGNLDEAAKIKNDMEAQANSYMFEDARRNSAAGSEKRVDRLENRKETLDAQRDRALAALARREKDEKASLARREKAEKRSLEKRTRANEAALRKQAEDAKASMQARWQNEKMSFEQRLTLFKSYIARDQKDLKRWMKSVGLSYDDFGGDVKKKGESWSQFFERSMVKHMRVAGNEMASDNMWSGLGAKNALKIAQGMGFPSMASYKKFVTTGKLPDTFGKNLYKGGGSSGSSKGDPTKGGNGRGAGQGQIAQHGGGIIGAEKSNRRGVARTLRGLHPSEQLINARKGEYLIPKERVAGNEGILDSIRNGGKYNNKAKSSVNYSVRNTGDGIGGANNPMSGLSGIMYAMMGNAMAQGMAMAFKNRMSQQVAEASASYTAGKAGQYGDRSFGSEQLTNAAIIASQGRDMGMSARDIMIGIMTAITESGLVNVKYGDRDSQGLFQQRPSQGWGTVAQVTDPVYSSRKFFSALKGIANRDDMAPWVAAQAVQRSAFADGRNYQIYWDEANAIFKNGGLRTIATMDGGVGGMNYRPGKGGLHRPSVPGKGWSNSHDYRNGLGSPLYAWADGRVSESRSIRSGGSSDYPGYPRGWTSYGETVVVTDKNGNSVRYAHMSPNTRIATGPVKGGTMVGLSGSTGNSSGPHTHFEWNGSYSAREAFARIGIGLNTGGYTKSDGIANLHKEEVVISPGKTKELYEGIGSLRTVMNAAANNIGLGVGGKGSKAKSGKKKETEKKAKTAYEKVKGSGIVGGEYGNLNPGIMKTLTDAIADNSPNAAGGVDTPVSGVPSSALEGIIRSGTYNMQFTKGNAGNIEDLKRLTKMVDILSLQEVTPGKAKMKPWLASLGWDWFQKHRGTALIWNAANLAASNLGVENIGGSVHPYATYGKFRNTKGGGSAWQISTHLEPYGKNSKVRDRQFNNLSKLVGRLRGQSNTPVILSGDFNTDNVGRMKMGAATGESTRTHGKGRLDHILYTGAKKSGQQVINTAGSDHKAVIASFNLPQLNTGGYTMSDGMAMLHKKELVISPEKTRELYAGIEKFANGDENNYNSPINITINGYQHDAEELADRVMNRINAREARRPGTRNRR